MRNDVKQNLDSVKQTRVAQPRRALALATMFGLLAAGAGQLALAAEQTFASDLATASSKQRAIKDVDLDTGPWPLCSGETNTKALADGEQVLGLYPMGDGTYLVHTVDAIDSKTCVKSTTADLAFQFEGSTAKAVIADSTPPGSPIVYDFSGTPAELGATVTEPVICHGYYTAGDKLALVLTDSNGDVQELRGVDTVGYQLSNGTVTPLFAQAAHGPVARCHVFPYGDTIADPPTQPAPASDILFGAGFESTGDLEVLFYADDGSNTPLLTNLVQAYPGIDFSYKVRIRNLGEVQAHNVRVREFLPAITGVVAPGVTATSCAGPMTCSGALDVSLGSLDPDEVVEFTLTRKIPAGVGQVDDKALIAVAVFSDLDLSGDPNLTNNARALVVQLVDNQSPTINCAGLTSPLALIESQSPTPVTFACTVTDPDPDDTVTGLTAVSSDADVLLASTTETTPGTVWDLVLTPQPGEFGSVTVTLTATSSVGPSGTQVFTVNLAEVNDPPTFDLANSVIVLSRNGMDVPLDEEGESFEEPAYPGLFPNMSDNCFESSAVCTISIQRFIQNVSGGPGEDDQNVVSVTTSCSATGGSVSSMFSQIPTSVASVGSESDYDLSFTYRKQANPSSLEVTCAIRFQDDGNPPETSSDEIVFTYSP